MLVPIRRVQTLQPQGPAVLLPQFNGPNAQAYVPSAGLSFSSGAASGLKLAQTQTNPAYSGSRIVTRNGRALRVYADHGGNADDVFVFPLKTTVVSAGQGSAYTIVCQYESINSGSRQGVFTAGKLLVSVTETGILLGFLSSNGYEYYYTGPAPTTLHGKLHTVVISILRGSNLLNIFFDGVELFPNTGQATYISGAYGELPVEPIISPSAGYVDYYHLNGYVTLAAALPNVFLNRATAAAVCSNPWQIFAPQCFTFPLAETGGVADGSASGTVPALNLSAPAGAASGSTVTHGSASGSVSSSALAVPVGTAVGTSVANGSASGSLAASTSTAPEGTASGSTVIHGAASASVAAVALACPGGSAVGTTVGAGHGVGAVAALALLPPSGSASATTVIHGFAGGALATIPLLFPTGSAYGSTMGHGSASGLPAGISISPPSGAALGTSAGEMILTQTDIDQIAAASAAAVLAALNATTIPVNIAKVNNVSVIGTGTQSDPWNPA